METKTKKALPWIVIVVAFAVMYAIGLVYMLTIYPIIEEKLDFWVEWLIRYTVIFGIGLPVFMLISRKAPVEKTPIRVTVSTGRFLKYLIISLGAATAGGMIGNLLIAAVTGTSIEEAPNYFSGGSVLGAFLFLCVIPPVLEELFFRNILLKKLNVYGNGIAIIGTALAFAIYHTLLTYAQVVHVFLLGIVFAYVMLRTKNIACTIILHSIVNLWSVINSRVTQLLSEPLSILVPLLILPIMICFIIIVLKNRRKLICGIKSIVKNLPIEPLQSE